MLTSLTLKKKKRKKNYGRNCIKKLWKKQAWPDSLQVTSGSDDKNYGETA